MNNCEFALMQGRANAIELQEEALIEHEDIAAI